MATSSHTRAQVVVSEKGQSKGPTSSKKFVCKIWTPATKKNTQCSYVQIVNTACAESASITATAIANNCSRQTVTRQIKTYALQFMVGQEALTLECGAQINENPPDYSFLLRLAIALRSSSRSM